MNLKYGAPVVSRRTLWVSCKILMIDGQSSTCPDVITADGSSCWLKNPRLTNWVVACRKMVFDAPLSNVTLISQMRSIGMCLQSDSFPHNEDSWTASEEWSKWLSYLSNVHANPQVLVSGSDSRAAPHAGCFSSVEREGMCFWSTSLLRKWMIVMMRQNGRGPYEFQRHQEELSVRAPGPKGRIQGCHPSAAFASTSGSWLKMWLEMIWGVPLCIVPAR